MSVETAGGDIDAVDFDACVVGIAGQGDTLCGSGDLHLLEVAQGVCHRLLAAVEGVLYVVGRAIG